jgi:predicted metal-dependent hydrolase
MVEQLQASMEEDHFTTRPGQIELRIASANLAGSLSGKADWRDQAEPTPAPNPGLRGSINNSAGCSELLRQWLGRKARAELAPWLRELSFDLNLPFRRISIRGQKTRWASCSSQGDISLNYKLLFLPTDLVHYVFVHELCHTIHMNHSSGFWRLVAEKYPAYGTARGQLKEGWRYVPGWVEG